MVFVFLSSFFVETRTSRVRVVVSTSSLGSTDERRPTLFRELRGVLPLQSLPVIPRSGTVHYYSGGKGVTVTSGVPLEPGSGSSLFHGKRERRCPTKTSSDRLSPESGSVSFL